MRIGEFASICNTKISVLRHYDKEGILIPETVDKFTGYRYYSRQQIDVFLRITALKKAGFSLSEIKQMLSRINSDEELLSFFQNRKKLLASMLSDLEEAQKIIIGDGMMYKIQFNNENGVINASTRVFDANNQNEARNALAKEIFAKGYQRVSDFVTMGKPYSNNVYITCEVVKLLDSPIELNDNINLHFENDPRVIGKWETVGEYAVKGDFYGDIDHRKTKAKEIYFLPGGERYWCYGWTKGKLICSNGDGNTVNEYTLEEYEGETYMFVSYKSREYRFGGRPSVLVLRQVDNNEYSVDDISIKDDISLPFVDDPVVIGNWTACGYCSTPESFEPNSKQDKKYFFSAVEFENEGKVKSRYNFGESIVEGENMQVWTKGYILRKFNSTACAYTIRIIEDTEYLFIQWKSGDYVYGGFEPKYYVFTRN